MKIASLRALPFFLFSFFPHEFLAVKRQGKMKRNEKRLIKKVFFRRKRESIQPKEKPFISDP